MRIAPKPALAAALGGALALASLAVRAGDNLDPSASASASAGAPDAGPPLPRFDAQPFGEEPTPRPSADDWKPVTPVALSDALPSKACRAYRLREWVKIHCESFSTSSIALLGGAREDVFMFLVPGRSGSTIPEGGEVMFAVRRGDRRMFEWSTFGDSYEGPGSPEVAFMISESWPPGDAAPTLIAH